MGRKVKRVAYAWRVLWGGDAQPDDTIAIGAGTFGAAIKTLVTQAELEDFDDNCLVKRLVGEVYWHWQAQDGMSPLGWCSVKMGVTTIDQTGFNPIPRVANEAQDTSWAWLRTFVVTGSGLSNEGGNVINLADSGGLMSAHIDAPINRRLHGGDELQLSVVGENAVGSPAAYLYVWYRLRILCEV